MHTFRNLANHAVGRWPMFIAAVVLSGCGGSGPFDVESLDAGIDAPPRPLPITATDHLLAAVEAGPSPHEPALLFADHDALRLDALIDAALRRNPSITAMQQAWRAMRARVPQATSLDDPMLTYAVAPESLSDHAIDDGHEVELSQKLPWPGTLRLRGRVAEHESEAAGNDVQTLRRQLTVEAARGYYEYYYLHRAIQINRANLQLLGEFQRIAETKYAAGAVTKQDPLQAEVERYHLEHQLISLERMRRVSQARLNTLLHRAPEATLPPPPEQLDRPRALPDASTLRDRAVNARPELQSLAQRLEAKRAARELARKEYYPDVTVMGVYNSMWDVNEHRWMIGAGINVPLQLDRRRGAEAEALAEATRIAAELAAGVDRVTFEVAEAYEMLVESQHVVHLYEGKFLPVAEENLQAARAGYETGKGDFLALLTAERNLLLVQLAHEQAMSEYHRRWAELERAVGGRIDSPAAPSQPHKDQTKGDPSHEG